MARWIEFNIHDRVNMRVAPARRGYCVINGCTTVVSFAMGLERLDGTRGLRFSAKRWG